MQAEGDRIGVGVDGEADFAPVTERLGGNGRIGFDLDMTDAAEGFADGVALELELSRIRHVLELAAAAHVVDGADRLDAVRRCGDELLQVGTTPVLGGADDFDFAPLAAQGARDEMDDAVVPGDAFATRGKRVDVDGNHACDPFSGKTCWPRWL
jgi:hypothetical protein